MTEQSTATADDDAVLPAPAVATRGRVATDVALVATFGAFITVCAILPGIPTPSGVPITLQTFAVILAGLVLGWRRGALAVLLYLAVGFAGLPVFSGGKSGLSVLAGVTGGYLIAFPIAAVLAGVFAGFAVRVRGGWRVLALFGAGLGASLLSIHPLGVTGLVVRGGLSWTEAIAADAVFLPGDVVKNVVAAVVAISVFAAFPELRRTRR